MQVIGMMCFSIYVWHGRPIELLLQPDFSWPHWLSMLHTVAVLAALQLSLRRVSRRSNHWRSLFTPAIDNTAGANQRR